MTGSFLIVNAQEIDMCAGHFVGSKRSFLGYDEGV
jgi:hypothetical protein